MTLRDYWRVLRERWKLVVGFVLLSVGLAVLISALTPKTYEATAEVFAASNLPQDPNSQYSNVASVLAQMQTFARLIDDPQIVAKVSQDLNVPKSQIAGKLTASAPTGQTLIDITVDDSSPNLAASIANSAAKAFAEVVEGYTTPSSGSTPAVQLFTTKPADVPNSPVSPKPVLNIAIGLLLGLLIGAALAVIRDVLDNRIKAPDELAKVAGAPSMGVVLDDPKAAKHPIATKAGTRNLRAENFRQLRANLQFANVDAHPRVIAVTSSIPSEGKTMVAINLASTLAEAGFTVCLVDADLRRPTVAKVMGLPSPVGLTSVLIHQLDLSEALQNAGPNLFVLSSGPTPPNPSEVLASSYVRDVIRSLLNKVDYVIVDTAPLLPVADGSEVAALADGALLVARHRSTTDTQVKRAVASLARVDATLLGVVLNRMPNRRGGDLAYSYYRDEDEPAYPAHRDAVLGRWMPWRKSAS